MKPVAFDYERARDVSQAVELLRQANGDGKLLAGGQSLGPMLNLRLVRPRLLIDVRLVDQMRGVETTADAVMFGAAVTHAEIEDGAVPDRTEAMLAKVAAGIAYRAVRNRGTIGGSLVHADPAADWICALWAMGAFVHLVGPNGKRRMSLVQFLPSPFTSALAEGEILVQVEVPRLSNAARWGFYKVCRKVGKFADAIGAVVVDPEKSVCRIVVGALDGPPVYLPQTARALASEGPQSALQALSAELARNVSQSDPVDQQLQKVAVARAISQVFAP